MAKKWIRTRHCATGTCLAEQWQFRSSFLRSSPTQVEGEKKEEKGQDNHAFFFFMGYKYLFMEYFKIFFAANPT